MNGFQINNTTELPHYNIINLHRVFELIARPSECFQLLYFRSVIQISVNIDKLRSNVWSSAKT